MEIAHRKQQYSVKRLTNSLFLKIRKTAKSDKKRKGFLKPYFNINNPRFNWLENDYLKYLCKWKENIENQQGPQNAKDHMFLSWQAYEDMQISVHTVIEITKYLLPRDMKFMVIEPFNQDPVEEYFDRQRKAGC